MIFVDASAFVAILTEEPEADELGARLLASSTRMTSAIAVYEATLAVARKKGFELDAVALRVERFMRSLGIDTVEIGEPHARLAIDAHARYGKGRHPAALNMGDCFAYACAKLTGAELLYKGVDFDLTDLRRR